MDLDRMVWILSRGDGFAYFAGNHCVRGTTTPAFQSAYDDAARRDCRRGLPGRAGTLAAMAPSAVLKSGLSVAR